MTDQGLVTHDKSIPTDPKITTDKEPSPKETMTYPNLPPHDKGSHTDTKISAEKEPFIKDLRHAYSVFLRTFSLAFGLRYGLSSILRFIQILRSRDFRGLVSLNNLFSEKYLIVRVDAVRLGLAAGSFGGAYNLLTRMGERYRGKKDGWNNFVAGLVSGSALLFLEKEFRRTVSLYVLGRVAECIYNSLKSRGLWHFWGSHWNHGDTLLFCLASAQVMYAYVMRPETLDESYYKFIVRSGPIAETVLQAVRANNRGKPIDLESLFSYVRKVNPLSTISDHFTSQHPPIIPCEFLHPQNSSCTKNVLEVLLSSMKKILPLYATLTFLPMLVVNFVGFLNNPVWKTWKATVSTVQSTAFLSTFIALYMAVVCLQRKVVTKDHRFVYWLAGAIASLSILIEKKSRRSELALYALPRGLDSLYMLLLDRKWMASVPNGELILFSLSMAGIMYFYDNEPHTMSPWFSSILDRIVRIKKKKTSVEAGEMKEDCKIGEGDVKH